MMRERGFTLLEMTIVLAMVGLLISLIPPVNHRLLDRMRLESATRSAISAVDVAKLRAEITGKPVLLHPADLTFQSEEAVSFFEENTERQITAITSYADGSVTDAEIVLKLREQRRILKIDGLMGSAANVN